MTYDFHGSLSDTTGHHTGHHELAGPERAEAQPPVVPADQALLGRVRRRHRVRRAVPYHHRGTDPAAFAEKLKAAGAATEVIVIDWYPGNDDPTGKKPD